MDISGWIAIIAGLVTITEVTLVQVNVIDVWYGAIVVTIGFVVLVLWPLPRSTAKTQ